MLRTFASALAIAAAGMLASCSSTEAPDQAVSGTQTAQAAMPDSHKTGEELYAANCATCHDKPDVTRAPSMQQLNAMSIQFLNYTLTAGKMKVQGSGLSAQDRGTLVSYLSKAAAFGATVSTGTDWANTFLCPANQRKVDLGGQSVSVGFGFDQQNTRSLTAKQAGLTKAQMSNLDLAWSIGFPDIAEMRSQGAIVGTTLFLPVAATGQMYAIDIAAPKPCFKWVYSTPGLTPLRTSSAYGKMADGSPLLIVAGIDSTVHAIDPRNGKAYWTQSVSKYSYSMTTGTPVILKDRVIVPVAQFEIAAAGDDKMHCCTNHGYVLSLDPKTGKEQWRYDTMEDAKQVRNRPDGNPYYGPSGAPIWNSPAIDEKRGLIFFGTGEANSEPTHKNTDSLIAIGLKDGKEKWAFQATGRDIYVYGCGVKAPANRQNCSNDTVFRDVDFGASLILGTMKGGKQLVYAGQKSGSVWAMDPDTGKVVWRTPIGTGGPLGGVHWGIAFADDTVYVPIASIGAPRADEPAFDPSLKPGLYALDAATGKIKWMFTPEPPAGTPAGRTGRNAAFSTAPAVIDGMVVAAGLDGTVFVVDAATGKQAWSYQTAKTYTTANGVPGKGGSVDANAITAANGTLFVTSGYGQFGEIPGNVLLAFKPKAN